MPHCASPVRPLSLACFVSWLFTVHLFPAALVAPTLGARKRGSHCPRCPENPHFIVVIRPVSSTARRLDRFSLCLLPSLRLLLKCGFCACRTALSSRHDGNFGELSRSQNDVFIYICDFKYLHGRKGSHLRSSSFRSDNNTCLMTLASCPGGSFVFSEEKMTVNPTSVSNPCQNAHTLKSIETSLASSCPLP